MGLRQFAAGGENHGRAAALKAIAYTTGDEMRDERNNRSYNFASHADAGRVLLSGLFLPKDAPSSFMRENFASSADQQQFVWSHLAVHEEAIHHGHKGANQHTKVEQRKPIISRHDVLLLDKRIFLDADGKLRPDGLDHVRQVVRDFLRENYTRKGLIVSFAIHDQENGNGNFHVHIVSSYRTLTAAGWGERVRPFGKSEWAVWAKEKQNSALKIQTRKLEALGVIPKAERTSNKRETLSAWKTERGIMPKREYQPSRNFTAAPVRSSAPSPQSKGLCAAKIFVSFDTGGTVSGKFEAITPSPKISSGKKANQRNPEHAGGDGGGDGGDEGGADFVLAMLVAAVGAASEKLRTAMLTGIGIPAAQADLASAKVNLRNRKGSGKGKARSKAVRPKFKSRHDDHHQNL